MNNIENTIELANYGTSAIRQGGEYLGHQLYQVSEAVLEQFESLNTSFSVIAIISCTAMVLGATALYICRPTPSSGKQTCPESQKQNPVQAVNAKAIESPSKKEASSASSTIFCENGYNQYTFGGTSACGLHAARFILSQAPANPQMIFDTLNKNDYKSDTHLFVDQVAKKLQLKLHESPWANAKHQTYPEPGELQLSRSVKGQNGIQAALKEFWEHDTATGAMIVGDGVTIGLRRSPTNKALLEFFDPHGAAHITENRSNYAGHKDGNTAYVLRLTVDEAVEYLQQRYPDMSAFNIDQPLSMYMVQPQPTA